MNKPEFSIIIPAYNEEGSIEKTISQIVKKVTTPHEIVVVNDCSDDKTPEIVGNMKLGNLRIIHNERNLGFVKALSRGFEFADSDILLPVMADTCDEYDVIDEMYNLIADGYDMVSGSRYVKGGKRVSPFNLKSICSRLIGLSTHFLTGIPTHDISNSFKMFKKDILKKIKIESKGFEVSMEIAIKAYYSGFKITEIPTVWLDRTADESKFNNLNQISKYWKWFSYGIINRFKPSSRF